jgi:hypothetical protein
VRVARDTARLTPSRSAGDLMTRVLYIAGWGRSGTTILDNLLGHVDKFVSVGELHNIWQRGLIDRRACGCGRPLVECDTWQAVFKAAFDGIDRVDPKAVLASQSAVRTRRSRAVLRAVREDRLETTFSYATYLRQLYDGIVAASGAEVIVDSSKFPTDAIIASGLPGYEVYVVHMVRDPRAVAYSWQRVKPVQDKIATGGNLRRVGYVRSTLVWQLYNSTISRDVRSAVGEDHYKQLHYERFATEPEAVVRELVEFVGGDLSTVPAFVDGQVTLGVAHTASGNPNRFVTGPITIRLDDEWREAMPQWKQHAVSVLAHPTLALMRASG